MQSVSARTGLIVANARIWSGNPSAPWARSLVAAGDRLLSVSAEAVPEADTADAEVIDAAGRLVLPGFIDSHVHFLEGGSRLTSVQLRDAPTRDAFVDRIRSFSAGKATGEWITGGDWDHENWGGELPARDWIDGATPETPIFVSRVDGHMALANSRALELAGIDSGTADVGGGKIERDANGEPTGVLKDNAMDLVARVIPQPGEAAEDQTLDAAMKYVAERGVTSVHHMGTWDDHAVFQRAARSGRLRTRIYASVPINTWKRLRDTIASGGAGDEWLRIGGLKGFADGSLGSRTAAFLEPYTDDSSETGLLVNDPEDIYRWAAAGDRCGLQAVIHAIGDRANRLLLDIYERIARENGPRDRRPRIEHAQHLAAADIGRFGRLGVIASMQPYNCMDDGCWAERVIGRDRCTRTYAFRSVLDAGARLAFGSDWFVTPPTPVEGIYAAVTRRTLDGKRPEGWMPEQKITVEEALRAYTTGGAHASFDDAIKGTLEAGKLADFVMLERDITRIPVEEIRDVQVDLTVAGGRIVHRREA